jgi:hypothetical protein
MEANVRNVVVIFFVEAAKDILIVLLPMTRCAQIAWREVNMQQMSMVEWNVVNVVTQFVWKMGLLLHLVLQLKILIVLHVRWGQ